MNKNTGIPSLDGEEVDSRVPTPEEEEIDIFKYGEIKELTALFKRLSSLNPFPELNPQEPSTHAQSSSPTYGSESNTAFLPANFQSGSVGGPDSLYDPFGNRGIVPGSYESPNQSSCEAQDERFPGGLGTSKNYATADEHRSDEVPQKYHANNPAKILTTDNSEHISAPVQSLVAESNHTSDHSGRKEHQADIIPSCMGPAGYCCIHGAPLRDVGRPRFRRDLLPRFRARSFPVSRFPQQRYSVVGWPYRYSEAGWPYRYNGMQIGGPTYTSFESPRLQSGSVPGPDRLYNPFGNHSNEFKPGGRRNHWNRRGWGEKFDV